MTGPFWQWPERLPPGDTRRPPMFFQNFIPRKAALRAPSPEIERMPAHDLAAEDQNFFTSARSEPQTSSIEPSPETSWRIPWPR